MVFKKLVCGSAMMENVPAEVSEMKELLYANCMKAKGPMSDLAESDLKPGKKRV
jgi:hypothetical protein